MPDTDLITACKALIAVFDAPDIRAFTLKVADTNPNFVASQWNAVERIRFLVDPRPTPEDLEAELAATEAQAREDALAVEAAEPVPVPDTPKKARATAKA